MFFEKSQSLCVLSHTNPCVRRCFCFFYVLILFREEGGTKQKWPNRLSFIYSQLASMVNWIKSSHNGLNQMDWLVGCLKRTSFLFSPPYERRPNYQNLVTLELMYHNVLWKYLTLDNCHDY